MVKKWKGNFINENNSCGEDAIIQSIIHTVAPKIFEAETNKRIQQGLPYPESFEDLISIASEEKDPLYKDLLLV